MRHDCNPFGGHANLLTLAALHFTDAGPAYHTWLRAAAAGLTQREGQLVATVEALQRALEKQRHEAAGSVPSSKYMQASQHSE